MMLVLAAGTCALVLVAVTVRIFNACLAMYRPSVSVVFGDLPGGGLSLPLALRPGSAVAGVR